MTFATGALVFACIVGVLLGYVRGGRLRHAYLPWPLVGLIWIAFAAQVTLTVLPARVAGVNIRFLLLIGSYALAIVALGHVWLGLRRGRARLLPQGSIALLAAGWFANGLAIAANGAMPVSRAAWTSAGNPTTEDLEGLLLKHTPVSADTELLFLADVIPVRPLEAVYSVGDLLIVAGLALLTCASMTGGFSTSGVRALTATDH